MTEYSTPPSRRRSPFPDEWGPPPVDPDKRAAWILESIRAGQAARARGEEVRWLHHPTPAEALGYLAWHVESPALADARRQAALAASRVVGRLLDLEARRQSP